MRSPGTAIGADGRAIGIDDGSIRVVRRELIGAGKLARGDYRDDDAIGTVCASVVQEDVAQAEDAALVIHSNTDIMHLAPFMVGCRHVFEAILNPLDRATQA